MKFLILLLLFLAIGCNKSGGGAFETLEDEPVETNDPSINGPVVISSVTPTNSVIQLISGLNTFAVQIESGAGGNVSYNFRLDGISVQDSTSSFYVLNGVGLPAGAHSLEVTASNPQYSDVHTFNLYVNSPPVLNIINNSATTISCLGGTFTINLSASDADNEAITFTYYLNGATGSPLLVNSNPTVSTATTVFTPTCAQAGINSIKIRATDINGAFDEEPISVTVSNPLVASITSFSPLVNPVIIPSTATQTFQISPDGTSPFSMVWTLTPAVGILGACNASSTCTVDSNGGTRVGAFTLNVLLGDQGPVDDTMDFNIFFNAKPVLSSPVPSTASDVKMKCSESKNFIVNLTDQNGFNTPPQAHSISWTYGGLPVTDPSIDQMFTVSTNILTPTFSSTLTFNPNCDTAALQGEKEIKVVINDGYETAEESWDVTTSYLSSACLNLASGQICTLAGLTGLGNNNTVTDPTTKYKQIISPRDIIPHHISGGMFISDMVNNMVWFYNHNTTGDITVFGKVVGPKKLIALFGAGVAGVGLDGETFNNFYLNGPIGMAWDSSSETLYVAEYNAHRIVRFTTSGTVGAGYYFGGNAGGANVDGAARTAHKCNNPVDLILSGVNLYASCYGNANNDVDGSLKIFKTDSSTAYTVAKFQNNVIAGNCSPAAAGCNRTGSILNYTSAVARTRRLYSLVKHPTKEIIFAGDLELCQIMAFNNSGSSDTFAGVTVANLTMERITNGVGCNNTPGLASSTTAYIVPHQLGTRVVNGVFEGLYISNVSQHVVSFLNFTGGNVTAGNRTVGTNAHSTIMGISGLADNGRAKPAFTNSSFSSPWGLLQTTYSKVDSTDGNTKTFTALAIADVNNGMLAYLDTHKEFSGTTTPIANGDVGNILGNYLPAGYDGEIDLPANQHRFNTPTALEYNPTTNELLVIDSGNFRVRAISLSTGKIRTKVGNGIQAQAPAGDPRLSTPVRNPRDIAVMKNRNALGYTDYHGGVAANVSCFLRVLNEGAANPNFFNVNVANNYVETVAGNYSQGCGAWQIGDENGNATAARLNDPFGVYMDPDGDHAYIVNRNASCILKVDGGGVIAPSNTTIGLCNTALDYTATANFSTSRLNVPGDIAADPDAALAPDGNFFFVDRAFNTGSFIKYANFSSAGIDFDDDGSNDVGPSQVYRFLTTPVGEGYVAGVAAFDDPALPSFDDWFCYSQGSGGPMASTAQNVVCRSRDLTKTYRIGRIATPGSTPFHRARRQLDEEQEGIAANQSTLNAPYGLAFDGEGNLYIADSASNSIKMVKRWWP
jgi:hypothetical protein